MMTTYCFCEVFGWELYVMGFVIDTAPENLQTLDATLVDKNDATHAESLFTGMDYFVRAASTDCVILHEISSSKKNFSG